MKVLSLFDGIGGARQALKVANIHVSKYYASEIDKWAISVVSKNFPDVKQVGDITKLNFNDYKEVDLLIGGSPCTGFSSSGKGWNFEDPKSKLFFKFVEALNIINPKYFLLENVKMKKQWKETITQYVGVKPVMINSSLVTAQNRKRLSWTNIPNVEQPKDLGIILKDVLEVQNFDEIKNENISARIVGRRINKEGKCEDCNSNLILKQYVEVNKNPKKTNTLTTVEKDNILIDKLFMDTQIRNKSKTVRVGGRGSYDRHEWDSVDKNHFRKLTPLECERLQGFPDFYTDCISKTQRFKCLGNSFTVPVIAHILSYINRKVKIDD